MAYFGSNYWVANFRRPEYWGEGVSALTSDPASPDATISYFSNQHFNLQYMSPAYWAGFDRRNPPSSMCTSPVFEEQNIDVIRLRLKDKKTGESHTFHIGREYFDAGELFPNSPTVYPLLADSPRWQRGYGTEVGIRYDVSIRIYGNSPLFENTRSFHSLREQFNFQGGEVAGFYYNKATGGFAAPSGKSLRQVLTIRDSTWNDDGILTISARDTWFDENKQLADRLQPESFPEIQEDRRYEFGNWAIGNSIVVDLAEIGSLSSGFEYYVAHESPDAQVQDIKTLYVRNPARGLDSRAWLPIDKIPPSPFQGPVQPALGGAIGASYFSLRDFSRAILINPNEPTVVASTTVSLVYQGSQDGDFGDVRLSVFVATYDEEADVWRATGSPLASADFVASGFGRTPQASTTFFNQPLVLSDQVTYIGILEWVNREENRVPDTLRVGGATGVNDVHISGGNFYYAANGQIRIFFPPSEETQTLISLNRGLEEDEEATPEAVTTFGGLIYWVDSSQNKLQVCDINGENLADLQINLQRPSGIDISLAGHIYFTEINGGTLKRCNLDGGGLVTLLAGLNNPRGLAIDDAAGFIFFAEGTTLKRYTIATGLLVTIAAALQSPWGVQVDPGNQLVYFSDFNAKKIYRQDYNGLNPIEIVFDRVENPKGVELDLGNSVAYWANPIEGRIQLSEARPQFEILAGVANRSEIVHYARDESNRDGLWFKQLNLEPSVTLNAMGMSELQHEIVDGVNFSKFFFTEFGFVGSGDSFPEGLRLEMKAEVEGMGGGSIVDPAAFIRFLLQDPTFGLGLDNSAIDVSSFSMTQGNNLFQLGFRIDRAIEARTLIQQICRQCRVIFFKQRDGKLAIKHPLPLDTVRSTLVDQGRWQAEMLIELIEDNPFSQVINCFENPFRADFLDQPADESFLRRARGERFIGLTYLSDTESSDSDLQRQSRAADSKALFGTQEFNEDLALLQRERDAVQLRNYLADRWSTLQQRAVVRLPRREWYTQADIFDSLNLNHRDIPISSGEAEFLKLHKDFEDLEVFNDGVRVNLWCGGEFSGEVVETYEQDDYVYFILETVPPFEA